LPYDNDPAPLSLAPFYPFFCVLTSTPEVLVVSRVIPFFGLAIMPSLRRREQWKCRYFFHLPLFSATANRVLQNSTSLLNDFFACYLSERAHNDRLFLLKVCYVTTAPPAGRELPVFNPARRSPWPTILLSALCLRRRLVCKPPVSANRFPDPFSISTSSMRRLVSFSLFLNPPA